MSATGTVRVGGADVTVRELTVGEIRALLQGPPRVARDGVELLLFQDIFVPELPGFCDVSDAAIDAATPSEIRALWRRIEEVNADFFGLRGRLLALSPPAEGATEASTQPGTPSSDETPPAASSAPPSP